MRALLPAPLADVDPVALHAGLDRQPHADRPWVLVNMVATVDGATARDGRSGGLGTDGDRAVFGALRRAVDIVLVAAGTVRAEGYGPARSAGRHGAPPRIAVVTRSGDLDPGLRLFAEAEPAQLPLVLTCEACPAERRAALDAVAEVRVHGRDDVDLAAALAGLRANGTEVVLCEGGPSLNGQLLAADLVDEWCQTVSPLLLGGDAKRAASDADAARGGVDLELTHLLEEDGALFARYVRRRRTS